MEGGLSALVVNNQIWGGGGGEREQRDVGGEP